MNPRELYFFLIQIAGQLSTLVPDADPSSFPAFNFTDLRSTFEELFALLTSLLRASVREACVAVPMDVREGLHVGNLSDERIVKCCQFVLAAHAPGISEEQLARDLPGRAKIASFTQLPFLLRSATRGLSLQVTHRPPAEVPVRPQVAYFLIDVPAGPSTGARSSTSAAWPSICRRPMIPRRSSSRSLPFRARSKGSDGLSS